MNKGPLHDLLRSGGKTRRTGWEGGGRCPPCPEPAAGAVPATRSPLSLAKIFQRFPATVPLCACLLVLGGCVHATKAQFTRHYALGGSTPAAANAPDAATSAGRRILQIARVSVPPWLAGTGMYYRLDYQGDQGLAVYGHSDWIAPPASLLEPMIRDTLASDGRWRAVIGPRNPATADASLHLQLDDFSQAFSQPQQSAGVLEATATLIDNHDDHVIAQRHFHIEVAAPTPDAQGGVHALAEASREFVAQLQGWLRRVASAQQSGEPSAAAPSR